MRRLGLFFKPPGPGTVKTRLSPPLSPEGAARLYEAFLEDVTALCRSIPDAETTLFRAGGDCDGLPGFLEGLPCRDQGCGDLGARMENAFQDLLRGKEPVFALLLGSDAPTLPREHLEEAFGALRAADVVLGPSLDGGYYLVGMCRPHPEVFAHMTWSVPNVLEETVERARRSGLTVRMVPPWYDVDTGADLKRLVRDLEGDSSPENRAPATRRALVELGLLDS